MDSRKKEQLRNFDPNGVGVKGTLFGLPFDEQTADVLILPVPWDVTVSYGEGTKNGPEAILEASPQIDYYLSDFPEFWKHGVSLLPISEYWRKKSESLREITAAYIEKLESGESAASGEVTEFVNSQSEQLNNWVAAQAKNFLDRGKVLGLLGGDHSTPLGFLQELSRRYGSFGILQIDAHADLRNAYEGFRYSHASIMHNAMALPQIERLVQVGIRDFCEEEMLRIKESEGRIVTFFDQQLKEESYAGTTWAAQCEAIIESLPQKIYVSFDIDGLDPKLCPNTGTPVAGGFELEQAMFLVKEAVESGREIIGFDLCEVCPGEGEWDANVGSRVLYRLSALALLSKKNG
ncbi:MAG: agmatinase family protein [Cytophagales bacterium]|nr:agmatinase family protein [Cytophagales bacterium]